MVTQQELIYTVVSYAVVFIIPFFLIAMYQGGFFGPYASVKASRGKKVLVKVRTLSSHYYKTGKIVEGVLIYKDRNKEQHTIPIVNEGCIYRMLGVTCVDTDEEKNMLYDHVKGREISGYDAVRYDQIIKRALQKPTLVNPNITIILLIVIIVAILALGIFLFQNYKLQKTSIELATKTYELLRTMQPAVSVTPGVV
jgi:predicted DNA-binding antitoxin AbrB/MazE fold protein